MQVIDIRVTSQHFNIIWGSFILKPHLFTTSIPVWQSGNGAGRGWRWCFAFKSPHSSPVAPLTPWPLSLTLPAPLSPSPSFLLYPWGRRVTVRRTRWLLSWQQLSVSPINYTGWLTPSSTLILAFIRRLGTPRSRQHPPLAQSPPRCSLGLSPPAHKESSFKSDTKLLGFY